MCFGDGASSKKNEFPRFFKRTPRCNGDRKLHRIGAIIISSESLIAVHTWLIYTRSECSAVARGSAQRWADIFCTKQKEKKKKRISRCVSLGRCTSGARCAYILKPHATSSSRAIVGCFWRRHRRQTHQVVSDLEECFRHAHDKQSVERRLKRAELGRSNPPPLFFQRDYEYDGLLVRSHTMTLTMPGERILDDSK